MAEKNKSPAKLKTHVLVLFLFFDCLLISFYSLFLSTTCLQDLIKSPNEFKQAVQKKFVFFDFLQFYEAGIASRNEPKHLYDLQAKQQWYRKALGINSLDKLSQIIVTEYTPPFCATFAVLTFLPIEKALLVWSFLQTILMVLAIFALCKGRNQLSLLGWLIFWITTFASPPALECFWLGQSAFAMTGIFALFFLSWLKEWDISAGILIALGALMKPHQSILMLIIALANKRWKTLIIAGLSTIVFYGLSMFILGPEVVMGYPFTLSRLESGIAQGIYVDHGAELDISLCGPLMRIMPHTIVLKISLVFMLIGWVLSFLLWRKAVLIGKKSYGFTLMATMIISLLCNSHTIFYDLVMLSVPWALILSGAGIYKAYSLVGLEEKLWCLSFVLFTILSYLITCIFSYRIGYQLHIPLMMVLLLASLLSLKLRWQTKQIALYFK